MLQFFPISTPNSVHKYVHSFEFAGFFAVHTIARRHGLTASILLMNDGDNAGGKIVLKAKVAECASRLRGVALQPKFWEDMIAHFKF